MGQSAVRIASSRRSVPMAADVGRELGHLEADLDVALGAQVVDLVGLDRGAGGRSASEASVRSP